MATPESPKKRGGELTMWAMVLAAAATVVGIALFKEQKSAPSSPLSAPAISLQLLEGGRSVPLPKGKVTLVDFWATWCAPCRASMPRVQSLWHEYSGRGMELYSVNTDDESPERKSKVEEFLQQNGLSFPVVLDDGDKTASDAFRVASLPTMMVIDRQGRVVWSRIGAITTSGERELRVVLDGALAAAPAARQN